MRNTYVQKKKKITEGIEICQNVKMSRDVSEKLAYKSGLDYLLKFSLSSTFGPIISILSEHFQTCLQLGL